MKITKCSMPSHCVFSRDADKIYYSDSFEAALNRPDLSMSELYVGIFGHVPWVFKLLLALRTKIVSLYGIRGSTFVQLNQKEIKKNYVVGDKIALFTLFSQDANEIVTGGNDKHLDFRVSVLKLSEGGVSRIVLTTIVQPHNVFGKVYLFLILPFHKFGVKMLLSNAVAAKRI